MVTVWPSWRHSRIGDLSHATTKTVADQRAVIDHRLALEVLVTRKVMILELAQRIGPASPDVETVPALRAYDGLGLVSEVGSQFPVRGHHLAGDWISLRSRVEWAAISAASFRNAQCAPDIRESAGCGDWRCQVLLRVSLDLRRSAPPCCNLVTQLAQPVRQLGLIDCRGKLLRCEQALRLDGARLAGVPFSDIENDRVGVELWRDIAIDRAGGVVLKFGGDELTRGLRWVIAADAGLSVVFELVQGDSDALPVRFADTLIAADKRGERDRFGRGKGRIPSGSVFHRLDGFAIGIPIFIRRPLSHKLIAGLGMRPLAQFREVFGRDRPARPNCPARRPCHSPAMTPRCDQ